MTTKALALSAYDEARRRNADLAALAKRACPQAASAAERVRLDPVAAAVALEPVPMLLGAAESYSAGLDEIEQAEWDKQHCGDLFE